MVRPLTGMIWRLVVRPPVAPANAAWKASSCSRAGEVEMGRDVGACSRRCTAQAGRWSEGMGATGGNCTAGTAWHSTLGWGWRGWASSRHAIMFQAWELQGTHLGGAQDLVGLQEHVPLRTNN